jgi:hypothetical protein
MVMAGGMLLLVLLACGCTQERETPAPPSTQGTHVLTTAAATPAETSAPVVTADPYPDAKDLGEPATFGGGDTAGVATVTKYSFAREYTWTSPSWRSAREQATYAPAKEVQEGYNTETPADGNTFLFVYFRVENTAEKALYAPSPQQIVVMGDGKMYSFRPVADSEVSISGISATQYDYLLGSGGTGGYVQPGSSNAVEGYLIYEIPASLPADQIYVVSNLDYKTQARWALACPGNPAFFPMAALRGTRPGCRRGAG